MVINVLLCVCVLSLIWLICVVMCVTWLATSCDASQRGECVGNYPCVLLISCVY